jgi:hypothetical protein
VNPLASHGQHERQEWFGCACCPPNIARLISSIGQYIYGQSDSDIAVHLYVQSFTKLEVGGRTVALRQKTEYPWKGKVTITLNMDKPADFGVRFRIPGWCRKWSLTVNGRPVAAKSDKGYVRLARQWKDGDVVELDLAMPVERLYAHPEVQANVGRVALQRGPIVYCLEHVDNSMPVHDVVLPRDAELSPSFRSDLLGAVVAIDGKAKVVEHADQDDLYRAEPPTLRDCEITAIPYYAWCNRGKGDMVVWLRE